MKQPKLDIPKQPIDIALDILAFIGMLILVALPIYYFDALPDIIPSHYGFNGQPDRFDGKGTIWTLTILGTLVYFLLTWLSGVPHILNYPQKITSENAPHQYKVATRVIRSIKALIVGVLSYITYATIQTAFGLQEGLGLPFVITFMVLILFVSIYGIYQSLKK